MGTILEPKLTSQDRKQALTPLRACCMFISMTRSSCPNNRPTMTQTRPHWTFPITRAQQLALSKNYFKTTLFEYTPKVCKNQIVTAGRLLTVLDMRHSTASNPPRVTMAQSLQFRPTLQ